VAADRNGPKGYWVHSVDCSPSDPLDAICRSDAIYVLLPSDQSSVVPFADPCAARNPNSSPGSSPGEVERYAVEVEH
jgi:hypothetical protein